MAILDIEGIPAVRAMDSAARLAHGILPRPEKRTPALPRRIVIIGGGPGGVIAAVRLQQAGYGDIVVLEAGEAIGGTWRTNSYPGCACDVQAPLYSFSFAPKTNWSSAYAPQAEILDYVRAVAALYGVDQRVRTNSRVVALTWDHIAQVWRVGLDDGSALIADIIVSAVGLFGEPNLPTIADIDAFKGRTWHSARWPADAELNGKRVAVIGSGATAVQIVPSIARVAREVHAFIRSPQWLLPRAAAPLPEFRSDSDSEAAAALVKLRGELFLRLDHIITFAPDVLAAGSDAARQYLNQIADPKVRMDLTPDSPWGCYRYLVSDDFYQCFNQPTVHAVREPINRAEPNGLRTADGVLRELDVIVFATGYHTTRFLSAIDLVGRNGRTLTQAWAGGPHAHLGIEMPSFPNLFQLYGPNTNAGSIFFMLEAQTDYIIRRLHSADGARARLIEVDSDRAEQFDRVLQAEIAANPVWKAGCANYYSVASGRNVTQWPSTMGAYYERTFSWPV